MSKVTVKHKNKTTYIGPGGWSNCPCCILLHYRNRKFRKKYTARVQRRRLRTELLDQYNRFYNSKKEN